MYTIYKHLNKEEVIYIGKSKSLLSRQRQHKKNSEWFNEVDSIEYCTLSSKIEMDIMELYFINTLYPKYNKKDNRSDNVCNVNIQELNWLNFDLCELEIVTSESKINLSEIFVLENIKEGMYITTKKHDILNINGYEYDFEEESNNTLQKIININIEKHKLKTEYDEIYDFKDVYLYRMVESYGLDKFTRCRVDYSSSSTVLVQEFKQLFKDSTSKNNYIKNLELFSPCLEIEVKCTYENIQENYINWDK